MKYTNYKVMMLDSFRKRYETISRCHFSKSEAQEWIKLYDPNNRKTFKIVSELMDITDQDKEYKKYIKQKIIEANICKDKDSEVLK